MITFLPYSCFRCSAATLDYRRLGKQRIEAKQILNTLMGLSTAWANHPAVLMWKGYNESLVNYGIVVCEEWIDRGYNDNTLEFFNRFDDEPLVYPPWFGDQRLHRSHQSRLFSKDSDHYSQFASVFDLPYFWPTHYSRFDRQPYSCEHNHGL